MKLEFDEIDLSIALDRPMQKNLDFSQQTQCTKCSDCTQGPTCSMMYTPDLY
jgi:hypothetical protein